MRMRRMERKGEEGEESATDDCRSVPGTQRNALTASNSETAGGVLHKAALEPRAPSTAWNESHRESDTSLNSSDEKTL